MVAEALSAACLDRDVETGSARIEVQKHIEGMITMVKEEDNEDHV